MSFGILPIEDTKSCGVSADKSADQNVADVPSDDLVSRQLLIGAIEKCGEEKIYPQALIQTIKALPSADRPKGEWTEKEVMVDEDTNITEWQSARCSVCGRYHTTPHMYYFDNFNFCPNCGADMRGEDDE